MARNAMKYTQLPEIEDRDFTDSIDALQCGIFKHRNGARRYRLCKGPSPYAVQRRIG